MTNNELAQFIESVAGESRLRVESDFGGGFVRLKLSEAEKRQAAQDIKCVEDIVLEALRNAYDAHSTRIYLASHREGEKRILTFIDDGDGIPESMHQLVFEPRVTSKLDTAHVDKWGMHGRGMALYSISVNTEQAQVVASEAGLGSSFKFIADVAALPEKTDQSAFPFFEVQKDGAHAMRGPKNILRTACEFALEYRAGCQIYVGSPAEIVATLYDHAVGAVPMKDRVFPSYGSMRFVDRPAVAFDSKALEKEAVALGLVISERTARRIIDGEIKPVSSLTDRMREESFPKEERKSQGTEGYVGGSLKISADDREALQEAVMKAFEDLARSYYLEPEVEPSVKVTRDSIKISIPIQKRS